MVEQLYLNFAKIIFLSLLCLKFASSESKNCNVELQSECQCINHVEETNTGQISGMMVECVYTTHSKFDTDMLILKQTGRRILGVQVRDSNLRNLANLPSGLFNIKRLILDNTGIDLETVRESHELLKLLKEFRVYNENFTEVPEDFFRGMDELEILALNDIGIAAISEDAFRNLEDSLKELYLRENKLRSFPTAIKSLSHLEILDLYGNEIKTVPDDLTSILQSNVKSLKRLTMNRIKCTCDFGKTAFVSWIRSHAIKGVTCLGPERLFGKDVSITPTEEFCTSGVQSNIGSCCALFLIFLNFIMLILES